MHKNYAKTYRMHLRLYIRARAFFTCESKIISPYGRERGAMSARLNCSTTSTGGRVVGVVAKRARAGRCAFFGRRKRGKRKGRSSDKGARAFYNERNGAVGR